MNEKIEFAYANAAELGVADPVVFVLDLRDDNARWLAERQASKEDIDRMVRDVYQRGSLPALAFAWPRAEAEQHIDKLEPTMLAKLQGVPTPAGQYIVFSIAEGTISCRSLPRP